MSHPEAPFYQCHKTVQALEIRSINGGWMFPEDTRYDAVEIPDDYLKNFEFKHGIPGYWVKYADGYQSWSPKAAFEEGYHLTDDSAPATPEDKPAKKTAKKQAKH